MYRNNNKRRIVAFFFAFFILLALLYFQSFVITYAHHDCSGESCPVCMELQMVESMIQQIGSALLVFMCILTLVYNAVVYMSRTSIVLLSSTPVKLKVRMND